MFLVRAVASKPVHRGRCARLQGDQGQPNSNNRGRASGVFREKAWVEPGLTVALRWKHSVTHRLADHLW